jgi:hypothetical protein
MGRMFWLIAVYQNILSNLSFFIFLNALFLCRITSYLQLPQMTLIASTYFNIKGIEDNSSLSYVEEDMS